MKQRRVYTLPPDKQHLAARARMLEWISICFLITITVVMYLAMGSSQAMKTAWIEDVLSLIPPVAFLVAMRIRDRQPNERFPYGYHRAPMLAFLTASAATLVLGLYMIYDATASLIEQRHPSIGHFSLYGMKWEIWSGWVMIAALIYSAIPPMILGRMKLRPARELHEKTLYADATMNKADWMTALAGILGIVGIGFGFWWADSAAAAFISLAVIRDGATNLLHSMEDLMDSRPSKVESDEPLDLLDTLSAHLRAQPDILNVEIRLREEGHVVSGDLFVDFGPRLPSASRLKEIRTQAEQIDWRLYELHVIPVESSDIAGERGGQERTPQQKGWT